MSLFAKPMLPFIDAPAGDILTESTKSGVCFSLMSYNTTPARDKLRTPLRFSSKSSTKEKIKSSSETSSDNNLIKSVNKKIIKPNKMKSVLPSEIGLKTEKENNTVKPFTLESTPTSKTTKTNTNSISLFGWEKTFENPVTLPSRVYKLDNISKKDNNDTSEKRPGTITPAGRVRRVRVTQQESPPPCTPAGRVKKVQVEKSKESQAYCTPAGRVKKVQVEKQSPPPCTPAGRVRKAQVGQEEAVILFTPVGEIRKIRTEKQENSNLRASVRKTPKMLLKKTLPLNGTPVMRNNAENLLVDSKKGNGSVQGKSERKATLKIGRLNGNNIEGPDTMKKNAVAKDIEKNGKVKINSHKKVDKSSALNKKRKNEETGKENNDQNDGTSPILNDCHCTDNSEIKKALTYADDGDEEKFQHAHAANSYDDKRDGINDSY